MQNTEKARPSSFTWRKINLMIVIGLCLLWIIACIPNQRPPKQEWLKLYKGEIVKYYTKKYNYIDIQTKDKILSFSINYPMTSYWYYLKENYKPGTTLQILGNRYAGKKVKVWGIYVNQHALLTPEQVVALDVRKRNGVKKITAILIIFSVHWLSIYTYSFCISIPSLKSVC